MFLALYTSCIVVGMVLLILLMGRLALRGSGQVVLCTECGQCLAACPLVSKGCNPMGIMQAAKSGRLTAVLDEGAGACVSCGKCREACPRSLAPYVEIEKTRGRRKRKTHHNPPESPRRQAA